MEDDVLREALKKSQHDLHHVDGDGISRRQGNVGSDVAKVLAISINKGWQHDWFYCSNPIPALPSFDV